MLPLRADNPKLNDVERESLNDLLARHQIGRWDFLLIGDASGSGWDQECAWASVSIERETMERKLWWGFANRGSINYAEVGAYEQPLTWVANREADRIKAGQRRRFYEVHVITDSQYGANTGNKQHTLHDKNVNQWERYESFKRQGILVHWHWAARETTGLNQLTDKVSKLVRKLNKAYNVLERITQDAEGNVLKTLYDINPDD